MSRPPLLLRQLGLKPYQAVWDAMRAFTDARTEHSVDEVWLVEHPPVFTLGMNGREEHLLAPGDIPVIPVDRGGQVTYHGPGQTVLYLLLDLRRRGWGVRQLVSEMENSVIDLLAAHGISAQAKPDAPGVYVDGAKIASLGLRVRRGRCYHGIALNVNLDLEPFSRINPCGYQGQPITRLSDFGVELGVAETGRALATILAERLHYRLQPETDGLPGEKHG